MNGLLHRAVGAAGRILRGQPVSEPTGHRLQAQDQPEPSGATFLLGGWVLTRAQRPKPRPFKSRLIWIDLQFLHDLRAHPIFLLELFFSSSLHT
jgi:hypothetical protein